MTIRFRQHHQSPRPLALSLLSICLLVLSSCSSPHFLPLTRPLFPGLAEEGLNDAAKHKLAMAKVDFQRGRQGQEPVYARAIHEKSCNGRRCYQGPGYTLTLVNDGTIYKREQGVRIEVGREITGSQPFHFSAIDQISD